MKLSRILLIICCLPLVVQLLLVVPAFSQKLYTWKDKNGVVRRTYYPPPKKHANKSQTAEQNQVELYVTSWCPYCKKARQFFESKGIAYKVYDIEKDSKAAARKRKLDSKKGVPFAIVNGTAIHGYSAERYAGALK